MKRFSRLMATSSLLLGVAQYPPVRADDRAVRECVKETARAVNTCVNHGRGSRCEKAVDRAIQKCERLVGHSRPAPLGQRPR